MNGRLPTPATAREVELYIESIGGLCQWKPLCPPFRGETSDGEDTPLVIPDDDDENTCPFYDGSREAATWYSRRAQDARVESYLESRGL